ncbi:hypothetical protein ACFXGA_23090 [Actinosynnema sp. NPDC059335]|uniref:hypothetical protein n=1 Tax=Actinosynnema sp. NPDC059335 TaxID=3346804 RepID=UPI00366C391A
MSIRPKSLLTALALCLAATGLVTGAAQARTTQAVDLPGLVAQAKERAAWEHPGADFFGADAEFDSPIWEPRGVERWALNFFPAREEDDERRTGFSYVYTVDGEFIGEREWAWRFGIQVVEEFALDQFQALDILRDAGYRGPFTQLYLAQPLVPRSQPTYYFCFSHEVAGVGAHSHQVFRDLLSC